MTPHSIIRSSGNAQLPSALIGHTGFVGSNLLSQRAFDETFNSSNIERMRGSEFDIVVCAGTRAEKWRINREPEGDRANILALEAAINAAQFRKLVLVSTIDVYPSPVGVDESDEPDPDAGTPYGQHRLALERSLQARFDVLVVRLPALVGAGLKKNAIYDLLHDNDVHKIHARSRFQVYHLEHLWNDIEAALAAGIGVLNLATEPVTVQEIARHAFDLAFDNDPGTPPADYDFRSIHAASLGGADGYLQTREQVLDDVRKFVARERPREVVET